MQSAKHSRVTIVQSCRVKPLSRVIEQGIELGLVGRSYHQTTRPIAEKSAYKSQAGSLSHLSLSLSQSHTLPVKNGDLLRIFPSLQILHRAL